MATHSSILAWKIPGTEKHGGLQCVGLQRVGRNLVIHTTTTTTTTKSLGKLRDTDLLKQVGLLARKGKVKKPEP